LRAGRGVAVRGIAFDGGQGIREVAFSTDGGQSWQASKNPPSGYRSSVIYSKGVYYACGTNGIDYSTDHGQNWLRISTENGLSMCTDKKYLYISCAKGKVLKMKLMK
jgi:photosystem II stability/assembly factor-like uncharacterized protein